jgi:glutathione S-transferase
LKGLRFNALHKEKLPSAIERYANEIKRVTGVLNSVLEGKDYLVGDKCTYADLSFIPWAAGAPFALGEHKVDFEKEYPNYHAWMERLMARPAVKKALAAMSV